MKFLKKKKKAPASTAENDHLRALLSPWMLQPLDAPAPGYSSPWMQVLRTREDSSSPGHTVRPSELERDPGSCLQSGAHSLLYFSWQRLSRKDAKNST